MKKRKWCYVMQPTAYEIACDICGGQNVTWSEFEARIWCYTCEKDTPGTGGIFSGPIPINLCASLGISFDRIDIKTRTILTMTEVGDRLVWRKAKQAVQTDGRIFSPKQLAKRVKKTGETIKWNIQKK